MPPHERSLAKVAKQLGKSETHIERWSSKYRWVDRAKAYDEYMANTAMTVRAADISEAQTAHIQRISFASLSIIEFGLKMLNDMRLAYDRGEPVDTRAYQRVARTIIEMDTAARRNLNLPTAYRSEKVEEPEIEGEVYVLLGDE